MPGLLIRVPTTFDNPDLPVLALDAILPELGALVLIDPSHPANPWAEESPDAGQAVPNIAYSAAKALVPTGTETTLGVETQTFATWTNDGVNDLAERTSGGGLHLISSQENPGDANRLFRLVVGSAINSYVSANKSNDYYVAVWGRVTRPMAEPDPVETRQPISRFDAGMGGPYFGFARSGTSVEVSGPTTNMIGRDNENVRGAVAGDPFFHDIGVTAIASGVTPSIYPFYSHNNYAGATNFGTAASMILYGYYLEDLSVSGRTYSAVHDLVYAKYTKDVLTSGGRYYNDDYTDPATIP